MILAFTSIVRISMYGSIIALVVVLARLGLRQTPKIYSYALWSIVIFRLLCPLYFTINVTTDLLPRTERTITSETSIEQDKLTESSFAKETTVSNTYYQQEDQLFYGNIASFENKDDSSKIISNKQGQGQEQEHKKSKDISQSTLAVLTIIWIIGVIIMISMSIASYVSLRRRLATASRKCSNIYQTDRIKTAFVLGIIRPKIYLPAGINAEQEQSLVLHEQAHLRRGDNLVKLVAFIALSLHWFNPMVWLSYKLMCTDMEQSCDEAVVKKMKNFGMSVVEAKKTYGRVIISIAAKRTASQSTTSY